ncbi:MAG: exopolysaccharide biosynthesis protein [Pseudomarimonas sp.]
MTSTAPRTSELLTAIAGRESNETLTLDELLDAFDRRAFGVMLLAVVLPAMLPIPLGMGAIVGPLVCLLGVQLVLRQSEPWMPRKLRQRPFSRQTFARFIARVAPWMRRLEHLSRPRIEILFAGILGNLTTGLMLVALGLILALPIPLTNYPLGILVMVYAFALIERDGALLLIAWVLSIVLTASLAGVTSEAVEWMWKAIT